MVKPSLTRDSELTAKAIQNGGYHVDQLYAEYARILGVESWPTYHRFVAIECALRAYRGSFEHAWYSHAISVSHNDLRDKLSDNRKRIRYVKTRILQKLNDNYSERKGVTKPYLLQPSVRWELEKLDRQRIQRQITGTADSSVIKDGNNKRVTNITTIRKNEIKAGSLHDVPAWCPVNMGALSRTAEAIEKTIGFMDGECARPNALAAELDSIANKIRHNNDKKLTGRTDNEVMRDYLARVMNELVDIIDLASSASNNGHMPHQYTQSQAGRWYATGPTSLQTCTKLARNAALSGFYSFDIESCHHAITLQIAQSMGITCEHLLYYVENKEPLRKWLANELGVPVSSIKASLIAMIYGAGLNPYGAISKELTPPKLAEAMTIPRFAGLHTELDEIFQAMLKSSSGEETGEVINVLGLAEPFSRRGDDQRRLAAHLLQGIESQALQGALEVHKTSILPLHDGWVTVKPESRTKAEKAIKLATEFDLEVNEPELIKLTGI